MKAFALVRPIAVEGAVRALGEGGAVALKASGIDLLDRMKEHVAEPERVVTLADVQGLETLARTEGGGLRIGARVTLDGLAASAEVRAFAPALAKAAGLAASPQLRRRATVGGNLGQHTRCGYYRHLSFPCLRRGGDECPVRAATGVQDTAGVFGNDLCASAHPSSVAPVLGALGATVRVAGPAGERPVAFADLWAAPAKGRAAELSLAADEVIVAVELPAPGGPSAVGYEEVRAKAAFDWALVSAAVRLDGPVGAVTGGRVWLGSVAPAPWQAKAAEALLRGSITAALAEKVGAAAAAGATPLPGSAYKVKLLQVAVKRAVLEAAGRR